MDTFKNKFFENNFISFLAKYEKFFKTQEAKFIINFLKILKKKNIQFPITTEHKNFIKNLYETLFINKNFENFLIQNTEILKEFKESDIDFEDILNKLFLLLSNAFIKYILKEKDAIAQLKQISSLFEFYIEYLTEYINEPIISKISLPKEIKDYYLYKKELYLFNVYKGVPITNNSIIEFIDEEKGEIEVNANYYQIVASKFQKEIYFLEPTSQKTFKAFVKDIFPKRKILRLYHIEKVSRNTPKRNYIRVQPKEEITTIIQKGNQKFKTTIYDISLRGCALLSETNIPIEIGNFVKLSFSLDKVSPYVFNLEAELKSISKLNDDLFRYHFYFEPNLKEEKILVKYVTQREKEIIKELHQYLKKEIVEV